MRYARHYFKHPENGIRRDNVGIWQKQLPLVNPHPKYYDVSPLAEIQRGSTNKKLNNETAPSQRRNSENNKNLSHYEGKLKQNAKDFSSSEKPEKSGSEHYGGSDSSKSDRQNNKEANPSDKVMSEKAGSNYHDKEEVDDEQRSEKASSSSTSSKETKNTNNFSNDRDEHWKDDVSWNKHGGKGSFDTGKSSRLSHGKFLYDA